MRILDKAKSLIDKDIVKVNIKYIDFDGNEKEGIMEVHKEVRNEVLTIFEELKKINFPIYQIKTIDNYNYSDLESVKANNSSSYNFRFVAGTTKLSDHAIGLAIDINPAQNPWIHPSALNIFKYEPGKKGTIEVNSDVVRIFEKHGWSWGGNWKNPDYQHFFKGGDINKKIKNSLYDELGIENPYLQNKKETNRISRFKDFVKRLF
jgi:hypothetical protein